jgi:hypothetical protein
MTPNVKHLLELDTRLRDMQMRLSIMYTALPRQYLLYWGHIFTMRHIWGNLIEIRVANVE